MRHGDTTLPDGPFELPLQPASRRELFRRVAIFLLGLDEAEHAFRLGMSLEEETIVHDDAAAGGPALVGNFPRRLVMGILTQLPRALRAEVADGVVERLDVGVGEDVEIGVLLRAKDRMSPQESLDGKVFVEKLLGLESRTRKSRVRDAGDAENKGLRPPSPVAVSSWFELVAGEGFEPSTFGL